MAIIVQMPSPRPRSAVTAEVETGATILFFTGVRYERDLDLEDEPQACSIDLEMVPAIDPATAVAAV